MRYLNRTIRIGIVVGVLFFCWWMRDIFAQNWHFRLFSASHWNHVWREFQSGWIISTAYEWAWVLTVLLMVPIFCLLWWGAVKVSWRKTVLLPVQKLKALLRSQPTAKDVIRKKIKIKTKASHKTVRPKPIVAVGRPATKKTGRTMDAKWETKVEAAQTTIPAAPTTQAYTVSEQDQSAPASELPVLDEDIRNIPLTDIQLPERIRLEEDLVALLSDHQYQVIQDVILGSTPITYVGISTDRVVLCLTDTEKGDWLADEEFFNDEEPLWFSETSHRLSPVYTLLTATKIFAKKMADKGLPQTVIPILIEKEGNIINANDMAETWKKMGVIVCRTDLGGPEELPPFGGALPVATSKGTEADLNAVRALF